MSGLGPGERVVRAGKQRGGPPGPAHHASCLHRLRDGASIGLTPEGRALKVLSRVHDERKGVCIPAHPEEGHISHLALPDVAPLFLLLG